MTANQLPAASTGYKHPAFYMLVLAIIVCIAWWPVSFHIFSLKNDALNYFLPVRKLVSESYYNGILPAWTPYLNLGYPLHGDMQSGVWNPIVQFFSLFGPYTLLTLQIETLLYVWLSGVGMFYLLRYFKVHPHVNLSIAAGYMLCGFNSDSAQFLNWIAGAAFLPFVFLFYYRCLDEKKKTWAIATGISLYFYFTCSYPADFIILLYLLAALFVWHTIKNKVIKTIFASKAFWLTHLLLLVIFIILALPAMLSFYENLPLTERGAGATYEEVMSNPLHPALLSTYFYPPSGWKMPGVGITDPLERNSYFGIFPFIFFVAALFTKSFFAISRFNKMAVLVFLLFSFGEMGGIRIISYYILPLMDSFRHPANARLFTIFFSCLLAAELFQQQLESSTLLPALKKAFYITVSLLLLTSIISLFTPLELLNLFSSEDANATLTGLIRTKIESLTYGDIVIICLLIQTPFLIFGYRWLLQKKYKLICYLSVINSVLFCLLVQPLTVVKNLKASEVQNIIDNNSQKGYPQPDLTKTLAQNSIDNEKYFNEIGCINVYNKQIGRSNYRITPSNLLLQNKFWFTDSARKSGMQKPFMYATQSEGTTILIKSFSPLTIKGNINASTNEMIVVSQTMHPRWNLLVDNQPQEIKNINIAFMGFTVGPGSHSFALLYKTGDLKTLLLISRLLLGGLLFFLLTSKQLRKTSRLSITE